MNTIRNMQTVAREIASNRRSNAAAAASFAVRSVNKSGAVSRERDHPMNVVRTQAEAARRMADMQALNPTRKFIVVAL